MLSILRSISFNLVFFNKALKFNVLLMRINLIAIVCCSIGALNAQDHRVILKGTKTIPFVNNEWNLNANSSLEQELKQLQHEAYQNGYWSFSVDSTQSFDDSTLVYVYLGQQARWKNVRIKNDSADVSQVIAPVVNSGGEELLSKNRYLNILESAVQYYEDNGYPFAKVEVVNIDSLHLANEVVLEINKGTKYRFDSLIVKGYNKINPKILWNRANLRKGALYNESKFVQLARKLSDINYIALDRAPEVVFTDEKALIYLFIKKKSTNTVNGMVGFLPNDQGIVEFTGNVQLKLNNALGGDEFIAFDWRRLQASSQNLNLDFSYPYLFNTPIGFNQKLNIFRRDTLFSEVVSKTALQYLLDRYNALEFFIENRSNNNLVSSIASENAPQSSVLLIGFGAQWSHLDYRNNPTKGYAFNLELASGDKEVQGIDLEDDVDSRQWSLRGGADWYNHLRGRSVLYSGLVFGHIESEVVVPIELYRLGGVNTIRGFDEEVLFASTYVIGTLEYRYLTDVNSYFSAFVDYANMEQALYNTDQSQSEAIGFGLGAAFETKAGVINLSYALGKLDNNPFLVRSGKIHIGFNAFF